jgi:hypothetical protein
LWCALFALSVQLLVLFNHVHCGQAVCWPASQPASGTVDLGSVDDSAQSKPSMPAAVEYCVFCAAVQLAGNVLPAVAPAPSLLRAFSLGQPWTDRSVVLTATSHQIFQARAPPLA